MKTKTFLKLLIWFILTILIFDWSFQLISTNVTFLNMLGVFLLGMYAFISIKTIGFTSFKNLKK